MELVTIEDGIKADDQTELATIEDGIKADDQTQHTLPTLHCQSSACSRSTESTTGLATMEDGDKSKIDNCPVNTFHRCHFEDGAAVIAALQPDVNCPVKTSQRCRFCFLDGTVHPLILGCICFLFIIVTFLLVVFFLYMPCWWTPLSALYDSDSSPTLPSLNPSIRILSYNIYLRSDPIGE